MSRTNLENSFIEFKEYDKSFKKDLKKIGNTISAALNSMHPNQIFHLFIGIEDETFKITGINPEEIISLRDMINHSFPRSLHHITFHEIKEDGKQYLRIDITGDDYPVPYKSNYYKRYMDETVLMTPNEVANLYTQKNKNILRYMDILFSPQDFNALFDSCDDPILLEQKLRSNLHIEKNYISSDLYYLSDHFIHRIHIYNDINKDDITMDGCFISVIDDTIDYFSSCVFKLSKTIGGKRVKIFDLDIETIREIIINSFVHNINFPDTTPRIEIYSSHIIFSSDGEINKNIIVSAYEHELPISFRKVNRNFINILACTQYMEAAGRGFQTLIKKAHPDLDFTIYCKNDITKVVIYNKKIRYKEYIKLIELIKHSNSMDIQEINEILTGIMTTEKIMSGIYLLKQIKWLIIDEKGRVIRNE